MNEPEYEKFKEEREEGSKPSTQIFRNIREKNLLLIIIFIAVGLIIAIKYPKNFMYILGGFAVVFIIYLLYLLNQNKKNMILRYYAIRMAKEDLEKEIAVSGCYPTGTEVIPTNYCEADKDEEEWNIGFIIKPPRKSSEEVVYKMNYYSGFCMGIEGARMGYFGNPKIKNKTYHYENNYSSENLNGENTTN
jgi:hypothetical protein